MRKLITRLLEPKDNASEAAYLLTTLLGAKISRSTLEKDIKWHPNYPSFLSISDVLCNHGIENITARFDKDKLQEIPTPFITEVFGKKQLNQFTVVKEINAELVHYYDPETQRWSKIRIGAFEGKSSGNILMAEIEEPVKERDYEKKIADEKREKLSQTMIVVCLPFFLLFSAVFSFINIGSAALLPALYASLTLAGVASTVLLLWYEVDQTNVALQDICTSGKKVNCGAILHSKEARIFGISWSTLGFIYFAGGLTLLLLSGIANPITLKILSWITLVVTPYVFYSVYYQWRVAKQWCVLCLSVQVVLSLQCILTFIAGWHNIALSQNTKFLSLSITTLSAFAIPFIIVSLLIPALRKATENSQLTQELQRLKHSPEIFTAVLEKQRAIEYSTDGLGITIGNPKGSIKIVKVCNPYCSPCARAHTPIEELIHNNPDLEVQVIFAVTNDENDPRSKPVRHLLAIDQIQEVGLIERALGDWYLSDNRDYEAFAQKYPMNGELIKQKDKISAMNEWCNKTEIQFTPTFFVNGYQLPTNYSVHDLKYFLSV